ncbi:MAG: hypothetical protein R3F45_12030 [Gammaproteobacteria bacterium]
MATLPSNPVESDLEDFVAAHLTARGVFVETGVTDRDPQDILELDVVWTDYDHPEAPRFPIEIKSGKWQLGDLFKFYGWTRYLDLPSGWFVCRQTAGRVQPDTIDRLGARMGIRVVHIDEPNNADRHFDNLGLPPPSGPELTSIWRYSFKAQRRLLTSLSMAIRNECCPNSARVAKDYFKVINDAIFFEPDIRARVGALLEAHFAHPKLALSSAAEIAGKGYVPDDPPTTQEFKSALYNGRYFPVQACLFLGHRARLALVKAVTDYVLATRRGPLAPRILRIFGQEFELQNAGLYTAFLKAAEKCSQSAHIHRYPVLWQVFLWSWGGFLLEDRRDAEYAALSQESGVPFDEIETALRLFDELFPTAGGWFARRDGSSRRVLKLMPAALRGIGAYSRLIRYKHEHYHELGYKDRTDSHLAEDHNSGVRLLEAPEENLAL